MKQYRVLARGRNSERVVILGRASKQVAKATAAGCSAYTDAKVQKREVTMWEDV